jgi:hypothetical protein
MKRLSKEHILMLHAQLIKEFGGSDGIRDFNLLDSALESPFQTFDGVELYPSLQTKAARLVHGTCHPASHATVSYNVAISLQYASTTTIIIERKEAYSYGKNSKCICPRRT